MTPVYLLILLAVIGCMLLVDRRWSLAFWRDARAATVCLVVGVVALLVTDIVGIALGVFFRGATWAMTGLLVGPELPIEELGFLVFLSYLTLNLLGLAERLSWRSTR
ncbi:MAG TPA: lycopene cyclase domain-containing protein [Microbacteriaceae bacterium]|nr:lycopene cyclase domain-containing protein [Microbacteriaceae bacterium]